MPPKVMITWSDEPGTEEKHGRIMAMPAYVGGEFDVAGLKWIPSVPDNPARHGLPRANALVLLSDRETGLPLAVMDGTVVSAMRTGAVTGVAVRHLADPATSAACLLGAGVLAHTQLDALRVVMSGAASGWTCTTPTASGRGGSARPARRPRGLDMRPPRHGRGRRCAAPRWWCRPRWPWSPPSTRTGWTGRDAWCWSRAWTARSPCTPSPTCWWWTTGCHESTHDGRYARAAGARAGWCRPTADGAVELSDVVAGRAPRPHRRRAADRRLAGGPRHGRRHHRQARARQRACGWGSARSCGCARARRCGSRPVSPCWGSGCSALSDRACDLPARWACHSASSSSDRCDGRQPPHVEREPGQEGQPQQRGDDVREVGEDEAHDAHHA